MEDRDSLSASVSRANGVEGSVTVPWRRVAVGSGVLTVAAVGALVVVAAVSDTEALTTIALSLAILSFVIQLIVFISQASTANQALLRSEQINSDTRALLSQLKTSSEGTSALVQTQFDKVLDIALGSPSDKTGSEAEIRERLEQSFREVAQASQSLAGPAQARPARLALQRRAANIASPPSKEEAESVAEVVRELTSVDVPRLLSLLDDEVTSTRAGVYVGLVPEPWADHFKKKGLIEIVHEPEVADSVMRLTDRGRMTARLLGALGKVEAPDYLGQLFTD